MTPSTFHLFCNGLRQCVETPLSIKFQNSFWTSAERRCLLHSWALYRSMAVGSVWRPVSCSRNDDKAMFTLYIALPTVGLSTCRCTQWISFFGFNFDFFLKRSRWTLDTSISWVCFEMVLSIKARCWRRHSQYKFVWHTFSWDDER